MNFNPRSREGSDADFPAHTPYQYISIHAPARGATCIKTYLQTKVTISIHAPARGATIRGGKQERNQRFQSTLPRGERHLLHRGIRFLSLFQSTLPRGERPQQAFAMQCFYHFNPRSREGSDSLDRNINPDYLNFNPRSREGSDLNFYQRNISFLFQNCLKHLIF